MKRATKRVEGTEKAISAATKQRSELSMKEALHFAEEAEHQADVLLEILRSVRSSDYERTKVCASFSTKFLCRLFSHT